MLIFDSYISITLSITDENLLSSFKDLQAKYLFVIISLFFIIETFSLTASKQSSSSDEYFLRNLETPSLYFIKSDSLTISKLLN